MSDLSAAQAGRTLASRPAVGRPKRGSAAWRNLCFATLATLLVVLATASAANASAVDKILERCANGGSLAGFSVKAYHEALQTMSADNIEYSECEEVIVEEEEEDASGKGHGGSNGHGGRGKAGGGKGGSGTSSSAGGTGSQPSEPTPEEREAIAHVQTSRPAPISVGSGPEATIHPGVIHANVASALSSLPTPLLAAIAALIALIALLLGRAVRERMQATDGDG